MSNTQRARMYDRLGIGSKSERVAMGIGAKRHGMTVEDYVEQIRLGTKWCYRCRKFQPLRDFCKLHSRRDGKNTVCRTCRKRYP